MTVMQHHGLKAPDDVRGYVMDFEQIRSRDLGRAGGKNAERLRKSFAPFDCENVEELAGGSSATAFAGAAETFLNVRGHDGLLRAVRRAAA